MISASRPVVVLDDSPTVRTLVSTFLRRQGCRIVEYGHPHPALGDLLRGHLPPPDILLVNLILPQMSGFTVIRVLRSRDQFRHTAIIVMSRLDGMLPRLHARLLGANAFLPKPFTARQLFDLVLHHSPH